MIKYFFSARDGKKIAVTEWTEVDAPKGIIQIAHGMAEHAGRYDGFARAMNDRGYLVFADDHRGHGGTDGETLGWAEGDIFNLTLSDLGELTERYIQKYNLPVIIFGHSYGSFLTQRYLQEYGEKVSAAILGGSSYMNGAVIGFAKVISGVACGLGMAEKPAKLMKKLTFDAYDGKFDYGSFISSVIDECDRYKKDELCGFTCSYNFYKCFFGGLADAYKKQNLIKLKGKPLLLISGQEDPVGDMSKGVRRLEEMYKEYSQPVKTILYEGVRHEYLNDISREQAFKDIADFCDGVIV